MEKSMKKFFLILTLCMISVTASAQGLLSGLLGSSETPKGPRVKFYEGDSKAEEEILYLKLNGIIQEKEEDDSTLMSLRNKKSILEILKEDLSLAAQRDAVKAVYIEINSPGGEVTCSDLIHHMFKKFYAETKKPIIAHIGSVGASGAYYAACGCNKIYALPTSMIGSIGVLLQSMNVEELAAKLGIKAVNVKSDKTPMKDVLSPFREMTEEERAMLLELVEDAYQRFVDIVAEGRKLNREDVIKLANGSVYTAQKALKLGLVDGIAYRDEVAAEICKMLDIKSVAIVKKVEDKNPLSDLLSVFSEKSSDIRPILDSFVKQLQVGNQPVLMFR